MRHADAGYPRALEVARERGVKHAAGGPEMRGSFERAELLAAMRQAASGPPLLITGPPGSGKTTLLHAAADALAAEGWRPVYLDLLTAATSPERFVQRRAGRAARGPATGARPRAPARRISSRAAGRAEGARAVQALLSAWAALDTVDGRPVVLLLDEPTEIRSLAYFAGLREVDGPFGAALAARPARDDPGHRLPRRGAQALAAAGHVRPADRSPPPSSRPRRARAVCAWTGRRWPPLSFGWPRYARILLDRLDQGLSPAAAWAQEMALGGRIEQACRHTYEVLLLRSRGYGMSKAVLAAVATEEGLNLTALVARLGRTPGAIRDYLGWLLAVDALRSTRKRYYYVDGMMRLWVRLHGRGRPGDGGGDPRLCARDPGRGRPRAAGAGPARPPPPGIDGDRLASPPPWSPADDLPQPVAVHRRGRAARDRLRPRARAGPRRSHRARGRHHRPAPDLRRLWTRPSRGPTDGLAARGYGRGDVFGIFSPNTLEYPLAFHGAARLGAVTTTVNGLFTADEVATQLRDCGAKCLFTVPALHGQGAPGRGEGGPARDHRLRRGGRGGPLRRRDRRDRGRRDGRDRSRARARPPGRRGRPALLQRHHRPSQGRDAHPSATWSPTSRRARPRGRWTRAPSSSRCCPSSTSTASA